MTTKPKLIPMSLSLAVAATLAASTLPGQAQTSATATFTDVAGGGGTFDYTVTLDNTGTESIQSFWLGWVPGAFEISSPSNAGNNLGWANTLDGNSVQYGGTSGTALAGGNSGTFTFDSTTTPASIIAETGKAGESTVYGVSDPSQFSLSLTGQSANTATFGLTAAVPEPSTFALLALGSLGFLGILRRKSFSVKA